MTAHLGGRGAAIAWRDESERECDVLVIGASAAGLAAAACLKAAGVAVRDPRGHRRTSATRGGTTTTGCTCTRRSRPRRCRACRCRAAGRAIPRASRWSSTSRCTPPTTASRRTSASAVERLERVDGRWVATTADTTWTARARRRRHRCHPPTGAPDLAGHGGRTPATVLHSSDYRNGEPWRGRHGARRRVRQLRVRAGHRPRRARRAGAPVGALGGQRDPARPAGRARCCRWASSCARCPTVVADALAAPLVRLTVGDITKVGLRKLPYGPNTQIKNDRHVPLLDIGTMDAHQGRPHHACTATIERFTADGCRVRRRLARSSRRRRARRPATSPASTSCCPSGVRSATTPGVRG